jgi:hypothetical protein
MFRMVRTLLIWLLALALPAQGVMAATMVFCGPDHRDQVSAAVAAHDAGVAHDAMHFNAQSDHAAQDSHAGEAAADETATPDKFAQSEMQKCSVCAACCSAAAIHDTLLKLPAVEPAAADFAALVPVVEPFASDGPDRPPRHVLA